MSSQIIRRGFLKLMGAAGAAVALARYSEPVIAMPACKDWIEDKGDYYIVRVPDFKTFVNVKLDKPAIFGLGEAAVVRGVSVMGFSNVYAPRGGKVLESQFDARGMTVGRARSVVHLAGSDMELSGCTVYGSGEGAAIFLDPKNRAGIYYGEAA